MSTTFRRSTPVPVPAERLFAWHARPGAFERLSPPWDRVRVVEQEGIHDGQRAVIELRKGPFTRRWVAVHEDYVEGRKFADRQESGPFAAWRHVHQFSPAESGSLLEDEVEYRLPLGRVGSLAAGRYTRRTLERTFAFRHRRTVTDVMRHETTHLRPSRIAVTGASGLIGSTLSAFLTTGGHEVVRFVRRTAGAGEIAWDPAAGTIDASALEGVDAVVHLAGERIDGRWSEAKKTAVKESRTRGTELVARAVAGLERKPAVLVCASAIGYYGDRGDELLAEDSPPGRGFLAEVVQAWEAAAAPARDAGVRVVHLRLGVLLDAVLPRLTTPFSLGLGGRVGSGRQWWSWVTLDDVVGAFHHAIARDSLAGPLNVAAPSPVRNADFARALGRVLHRPSALPLPGTAVKAIFGEMGEELLLSGQRISSEALAASGFEFAYPELEPALRHVLGR